VLPFGRDGRLSAKIPPEERSSSVQAASEQRPVEAPAAPDPARRMLTEQLPVLRAVARNLVRNANEVEDLVQDVYERTLRQIDRLDMMANPRGWMVTVLHNLHIDRCRQRARMKPHVPCDDLPLAAPEEREAPIWSAITAEDVRRAAAELPPELREPYIMFALDGRSYLEVAAALGIPKATVGTRISRARARLKELLTAKLAEEGS
jgi:RNA polymerase sigma-70 factor (ECF subfamily)